VITHASLFRLLCSFFCVRSFVFVLLCSFFCVRLHYFVFIISSSLCRLLCSSFRQVRFGGGLATPAEHAHLGTVDVVSGFSGCFSACLSLFKRLRTGEFPSCEDVCFSCGTCELIALVSLLFYFGFTVVFTLVLLWFSLLFSLLFSLWFHCCLHCCFHCCFHCVFTVVFTSRAMRRGPHQFGQQRPIDSNPVHERLGRER
jgi:hypothetical protein